MCRRAPRHNGPGIPEEEQSKIFQRFYRGANSRREFAVLQAVGMTGKQLEEMLIWEGLLYTLGSGLIAGLLSAVVNPLAGRLLEQSYWFYSYHYTISPVLLMLPVFLLLGCAIPAGMYHQAAKSSIVQRLREAEV